MIAHSILPCSAALSTRATTTTADSDRSAKTERQVKHLNKSRCCGDGIWCLGPDLTPVGGYSNCVFIQIVWWLQGPERSADGPGKRWPARSSDARGYQGEDFYLWLHSCRGLEGEGYFCSIWAGGGQGEGSGPVRGRSPEIRDMGSG